LPLEEGRSRGGSSGENPFLGGILGAFPDIWVSGRAGDIAPGQQTPVDRCGSNCWLFLYFSRYIRSWTMSISVTKRSLCICLLFHYLPILWSGPF
jgi:hypothetical protein